MCPAPIKPAFFRDIGDLPRIAPVFPLPGVILLPGGRIPLNIFEPRYLAMVQDILGPDRYIGMIQPRLSSGVPRDDAALYTMGCLGRISAFSETGDGRILLNLTGVIRFRLGAEQPLRNGYRRFEMIYTEFEADLRAGSEHEFDHQALLESLRPILSEDIFKLDPASLAEMSDNMLLNAMAMMCPLEARDKQALLEAVTSPQRADLLKALLEMGPLRHGGVGGSA